MIVRRPLRCIAVLEEGTMATPGYTGRILRVNLANKETGSIETPRYEEYGGYGMGLALFGDPA
jgi:hypothetical protein